MTQKSLFDDDSDVGSPQPDASSPIVPLSVAAAIELINDQLFRLAGPNLTVEGEVAEFTVSQKKWVRFTLKDLKGGAVLKCFLTTYQLTTALADGDRIIVRATPNIYPPYGLLTLNVNAIEHAGVGDLKAAMERLRRQLEAEGLFDVSRKRALPEFPERIGLVTSREAAACGDFLRILQNRWGGVEVELAHVAVQGASAVGDICAAIAQFNACEANDRPDVLVLTRGGGSLEDLAAFNAEATVRAVFASAIPMVVAVGHERDVSLCELAADVRASTPSNAAERLVPDRRAVMAAIEATTERLSSRMDEAVRVRAYAVERTAHRLVRRLMIVGGAVERAMSRITAFGDRLVRHLEHERDRVEALARLLRELHPQHILKRGFALVHRGDALVRDASQLDSGDTIRVQFGRGDASAVVE